MMEERLLAILRLAIKYCATDIHFTYRNQIINIELRIDGILRQIKVNFEDYRLIRYLQYLANLDIGNSAIPQTGQFELELDGQILSLRFAIIETNSLQNGVLRILNTKSKLTVDSLSNSNQQSEYFKKLVSYKNGLILFSGPTGSGKTTTLYTLLKSVKEKKIYTIEDPIEIYQDEFVQLQINEKKGFDYSQAIAQVLRHDPDIIMIGEIRESKAAKMAIVAANTGHLVFSTIHATKASSVISRMLELEVEEDHLYENLLCISNQRMVLDKQNNKKILYEIMKKDEIEYYRENKENSKEFVNIETQIKRGLQNGEISRVIK